MGRWVDLFYNTVLRGNPTAPTPAAGDNDTSISTTAFVQTAIANTTVANIAALRAITPLYASQQFNVLCHTTSGYGGGTFYYDSTDTTSADNNGTVIVNGTYRFKRINYADLDAAFFNIISDGTTDQTSKLTTLFTTLSGMSFRGILRIQYNTKFTVSAVYAACYVGLVLEDFSSINYGQPPGYKNRFLVTYSGDSVSDDTQTIVASPHHPTINLCNFGTAGSASATANYTSIISSIGRNAYGDLIDTLQRLQLKSPRGNMWRDSLVLLSDFNPAKATVWTTGASFGASTYCYYLANYYQTTAGGTTGATPPTHVGGAVSDGSVTWTYIGPYVTGSTLYYHDSDGVHGFLSPGAGVQVNFDALTNGFYLSYNFPGDASANEFTLYDKHRSYAILRSTDSRGVHIDAPTSVKFTTATNNSATPTITTPGLFVNNSSSTTITNFVLSGSMANGEFEMLNGTLNTGITHGGNIILKGGVSLAVGAIPVGAIIRFIKVAAYSGAWLEASRNF